MRATGNAPAPKTRPLLVATNVTVRTPMDQSTNNQLLQSTDKSLRQVIAIYRPKFENIVTFREQCGDHYRYRLLKGYIQNSGRRVKKQKLQQQRQRQQQQQHETNTSPQRCIKHVAIRSFYTSDAASQREREQTDSHTEHNRRVIVHGPCDVRPTCQLTCSLPVRPVITRTHTYVHVAADQRRWIAARVARLTTPLTIGSSAIMFSRRGRAKHLLRPKRTY